MFQNSEISELSLEWLQGKQVFGWVEIGLTRFDKLLGGNEKQVRNMHQ